MPAAANVQPSVGEGMRSQREPDAGKLHVRFDERRLETESWDGLRHRHSAKAAGNSYSPFPATTAPVVDSTREGLNK